MSRLPRFEEHRFVGTRDTMRVYDCDHADEFDELSRRVAEEGLLTRKLLQSFAPDTLVEAENRGFRPGRRVGPVGGDPQPQSEL